MDRTRASIAPVNPSRGPGQIAELRRRFRNIAVQDKSHIYNSNLIRTLETENMLELAEAC